MDIDPKKALFIFALQNAVKHDNIPKSGTVIGMVMGKYPELRSRVKEIAVLAQSVLSEVEDMTPAERRLKLEKLAPELIQEMNAPRLHVHSLPLLEGAENGVVMRFAPNPSGPLHLGHARAAVLNDAYVRRYGGRYLLRIEDTDPKRVDPEAYRMVQEDIEWMGLHITDIIYQSDRFDLYYRIGKELIELGGAYVCTCENDQFRNMKMSGRPCPCRGLTIEDNLARWEKMIQGGYYEGEASVRVRTTLDHPDPAMRDFPAFRILNSPMHPRIDAHVYPLMNFTVAVDDHLLGITHVIRGKDHIANTRRQKYIFDYFGWDIPVYRHYGRMGIEGVVLSTSQMREGIRNGTYSGWDDIRLGTLRALARRGIQPEAVRQAVLDIGIGETDISFSWDNLFAKNRDIVDPVADRFFFIPEQGIFTIMDNPGPREAAALLHPGNEEKGYRKLYFEGEVYLPKAEISEDARLVRLKDLFNVSVEVTSTGIALHYAGESLAEARSVKAPIIQWLPVNEALPCTLHTPGKDIRGVCEPAVKDRVGKVIQFERVCFARIDSMTEDGIVAYFSHR
jgi:glutamyl-tRNA synthetase